MTDAVTPVKMNVFTPHAHTDGSCVIEHECFLPPGGCTELKLLPLIGQIKNRAFKLARSWAFGSPDITLDGVPMPEDTKDTAAAVIGHLSGVFVCKAMESSKTGTVEIVNTGTESLPFHFRVHVVPTPA